MPFTSVLRRASLFRVFECRHKFFLSPRFREITVIFDFFQFAGDLVFVTDGEEKDFNVGIDLSHRFRKSDAAV